MTSGSLSGLEAVDVGCRAQRGRVKNATGMKDDPSGCRLEEAREPPAAVVALYMYRVSQVDGISTSSAGNTVKKLMEDGCFQYRPCLASLT